MLSAARHWSAPNRTIPKSIIFPLLTFPHFCPPTPRKRAYNEEITCHIDLLRLLLRTALVIYFPAEKKLNVTISHLQFFKTCADSIHLRRMPILSSGISNKLTHYFAFKYINIFTATPLQYSIIQSIKAIIIWLYVMHWWVFSDTNKILTSRTAPHKKQIANSVKCI